MRPPGIVHVRTDRFNFPAAHQDDLIGFRRPFFGIDQLPGLDGENARGLAAGIARQARRGDCQLKDGAEKETDLICGRIGSSS